MRRRRPELGWGEFSVIDTEEPSVLAHQVALDGSAVIAVHNFSADPVTVPLTRVVTEEDVIENLLDGDSAVLHDGALSVQLDGYGFRWFRVRRG